jgi:glutathione S-transferase
MRLFYSPTSSLHKVPIAAREKGVWAEITVVPVYPYRTAYDIGTINPLGKVPTLTLDDGTELYGSQTICEYLDSLSPTPQLFPTAGPARWDTLRRMALADTVFETMVSINLENGRPKAERRADHFARQWPKIIRGLDQMERDAAGLGDAWDIGRLATLHPLSYIDPSRGAEDPLYPHYNWRPGRAALAAWYYAQLERPSVVAQRATEAGDDSPENLAREIAAVQSARGD